MACMCCNATTVDSQTDDADQPDLPVATTFYALDSAPAIGGRGQPDGSMETKVERLHADADRRFSANTHQGTPHLQG